MPVVLTDEELVALQDQPPVETSTTPPPQPAPQPAPVEPPPQQAPAGVSETPPPEQTAAPVGPPPDEVPPTDPAIDAATSDQGMPQTPEQAAYTAAAQQQYGDSPATGEIEAGRGNAPVALPEEGPGVIVNTEDTYTGEPIQTPAPIPGEPVTQGSLSTQVDTTSAGPVMQKEQDIGGMLGGAVAPLIAAAPEPVQNLANIVGQPVGGFAEGTATALDEVASGNVSGGVADYLGSVLGGPQARGVQQEEERLAAGQPAVSADPGEYLANPATAIAVQPGLAGRYGPVPAVTGITFEDYVKSLPPEDVAAANAQGPGVLHQQWIDYATGGGGAPPPDLVNPIDRVTSLNPIEAVPQFAGGLKDLAQGIGTSSDKGTLAPFALSMAQQAAEDPLTFIPAKVGEFVGGKAVGAVKKLPIIKQATAMAPTEAARLKREVATADTATYLTAAERQAAAPIGDFGEDIPAGVGTAPSPGATIYPTGTAEAPTFEVYVGGQRVAQSNMLEGVQAQYPSATIAPSRAELVQQYEQTLGELGLDLNDPVPLQRLKDTIYSQNPHAFPEEVVGMRARTSARTAVAGAAPEFRDATERTMGERPGFVGHVSVPDEVATRMNQQAIPMDYRDGWRPDTSLTGAQIADITRRDADTWLQGFDVAGNVLEQSSKNRGWLRLNRRFNPGDAMEQSRIAKMTFDISSPSVTTTRSMERARFTSEVIQDALDRSMPAKDATVFGAAFGHYTNALRQAMLFNYLNSLHYVTSNLSSNTLNIIARGGGPKVALGVLTDLGEWGRVFRNQRDPTKATFLSDLFTQMEVGTRPNIRGGYEKRWMDRVSADDRAGRSLPSRVARKVTDVAVRAVAPETLRFLDSVPDVLAREKVGTHAILDGYHQLNGELIPMLNKELHTQLHRMGESIPPALVQRAAEDFLEKRRSLVDSNTGTPYTTWTGRTRKLDATYSADDFRVGFKENLTKELQAAGLKPSPGKVNRAVNDVTHTVRNRINQIADDASATVDDALFSWRNTVGDEWFAKGFLYHYWGSRQGGFYVSEAMKRPWIAASYGRMLQEMNQQAEDQGAPDWLKGWFRWMGTTSGYTTFYNPLDMVTSLLTRAQFQFADDPSKYDDLTALGQKWKMMPFFIHPALTTVAYGLGALGPDFPTPDPTGFAGFATDAINLLNLANAYDAAITNPLNAVGIGVDKNGNAIPMNPKPIQQLMAETGNAISSALEPLTGLSPVEVGNFLAGQERDLRAVGETEVRKAHPEWDNGTADGLNRINNLVTNIINDPGNLEYQRWQQIVASEKYDLGAMPQPIAGIIRQGSPIDVATMPEQKALDTFDRSAPHPLQPSGNVPVRPAPTLGDAAAEDAWDAAKYGQSQTVEGRRLTQDVNGYDHLLEQKDQENYDTYWTIVNNEIPEGSITINGTPYTVDMLAKMTKSQRYDVADNYLSEQGQASTFIDDVRAAKLEYLSDHPTTAAYEQYRTQAYEVGLDTFSEQMRLTNPGFAQYYQSTMVNHITGEVDYSKVQWPDAFLAASGVRPSVYSPIVGNEPSTAPGGYPSIPGTKAGQPILPSGGLKYEDTVTSPTFVYPQKDSISIGPYADPNGGDEPIATLDPNLPIQVLGPPVPSTGNEKYAVMVVPVGQGDKAIGWVDAAMLTNTSAVKPIGAGTVQQPGGGLVQRAGNVVDTLGGAKDALGSAIGGAIPSLPAPVSAPPEIASQTAPSPTGGGMGNPLDAVGAGLGAVMDAAGSVVNTLGGGHNSGTPEKPTTAVSSPGMTPGKVVVVPASDGDGIAADPVPSDQTWLEDMIGKGHATVTVQYKGGHPGPETPDASKPTGVSTWYDYQLGHGADNLHHAAVDVSCDSGDCWGTPIYAPVDGTIGCAGYGAGDSGNPAATCGYSQNTTTYNNDGSAVAHDVTITMGTDPQGNQLILEMAHIGTANNLQPGQQVKKGDLIATMGNGDCAEGPCPHTHVEAWGYSPELGVFRLIDPNLLMNGYYQTHGVDEGITPGR